jgi:hypothetical protein
MTGNKLMKIALIVLVFIVLAPVVLCRKSKDDMRLDELRGMTAQFEARMCSVFDDSNIMPVLIDPAARLLTNDRTEHHIPRKAFAHTEGLAEVSQSGSAPTIALGDTVGVLKREAFDGIGCYLVRTKHDTYGWVYGASLLKNGRRLEAPK